MTRAGHGAPVGWPLLAVRDVSVVFGGIVALNGVSFDLRQGQILGLIGPNGAGKTTFINVVSGVLSATEGRVEYRGQRIDHWPVHRRAAAGLVRTFQHVRLLPEQTLLTNIEVGSYLSGRSGLMAAVLGLPSVARDARARRERALEALDFVGLAERRHVVAGELSTGEQRLAGVARALAAQPELLLLDEPAAGLNETETGVLAASLSQLPERGITVLVVEHHMNLIMSISHRVAVFSEGRLIAVGRPDDVRRDPLVVSAYLGGAA